MRSFSDALLVNQPIPIMVMDAGMEILGASLLFMQTFGINASCVDKDSLTLLAHTLEAHTGLFNLIGAATMQLTNHGSQSSFEWQNDSRTFRITVFMFGAESSDCFGVILEDHTEEALLQRSIADARSYLEAVLESLPIGVMVLNKELRVTSINAMQLNIFSACGQNFTLLDSVGAFARELFSNEHDPDWQVVKDKVIGNGESLQRNTSLTLPDGSSRTFSIRLTPLFNENKTICGALRTAEDITLRVELEKKLKESEINSAKLETVHQISVTLSDSINNALTAISTGASLVQRIPPKLGQEQINILNDIFKETSRISGLIKKIRELQSIRIIDYSSSVDEKMIDIS